MKRRIVALILSILTVPGILFAQPEITRISEDVQLVKISDHAYVHVSFTEMAGFGRVGSNGMLFVNNGDAILFDTPASDPLTRQLVSWIQDRMGLRLVAFVPNHWHSDCMEGLAYLDSIGVDSYANTRTIEIARAKGLPVPRHGFDDSLSMELNGLEVECFYPGPAHTLDNIVVWIPSERILFAGCMVKEMNSQSLGNTADGDLSSYEKTIECVMKRYPDPLIVIPGHGAAGGKELLEHTRELASR